MIDSVYIIYSADVVSEYASDIESMSPAEYCPEVGARFVQTEEDEQYEYGYLGEEGGDVRYFPNGYLDAEGLTPCENTDAVDPDGDPIVYGLGQHRKWVGELTFEEWQTFADRYGIDLDAAGIPERYEDTLGSITEYGHLPAVCVDNREGWEHRTFSYGPVTGVLDSQFYISFARVDRDHNHERAVA